MKNKKGFLLSVLFVFFIFGVTIPLFMSNHRKVKADAINDLTGTTWVINSSPSLTPRFALNQNNITFTSNDVQYTELYVGYIPELDPESDIWFYSDSTSYIQVYSQPNWLNETYRTITITGGTGATNSTFISWLQNNATQQLAPQGTEITNQYWAPSGVFYLENNAIYSDNSIEYYILFNQYDSELEDTEQTGLYFEGYNTIDLHSFIRSNTSYMYIGNSNSITNRMLLEFNVGDYMDSTLYNFMNSIGYWFNDYEPYNLGIYQGYIEGHRIGVAEGQANGVQYTGLVTGIFNGLGSLLSIQVFPNITIGLLIGLPLLLGVLIIIIKLLRG